MIFGPTFEEMLHPEKILPDIRRKALAAHQTDPLDPINLFNITWRDADNQISCVVIPKQLTGVDANIAVLYSAGFPTGSHKVGAAYSVLLEKTLFGEVDPSINRLVWPSTGNYGIGGSWVGGRMGCQSIVVLPEEMSLERFELIEGFGASIIKTYGCESNVKEIYDETKRLRAEDENIRILNQFEVMGNYRFHYHATGNTIVELIDQLEKQGIGNGKAAAFVSAMGSGGTIAAGDRLKQVWPDHKIVGLEPIQCPTLYSNGYGGHDIQGIGDKHATWIHNVHNMDTLMCIDDMTCKKGLQIFADEAGLDTLSRRYDVDETLVTKLSRILGISSICNILGAIKTAKYYDLGTEDTIVTIATDGLDRYHSVMDDMRAMFGVLDEAASVGRIEGVFHAATTDWIMPGDRDSRERWHNLKYYTWVEQQGKTVEELDAQRDPGWWIGHQERVAEIDSKLIEVRQARGE